MKKVLALVFAVLVASILVGCGGGDSGPSDAKNPAIVLNNQSVSYIDTDGVQRTHILKVANTNDSQYQVILNEEVKTVDPNEQAYVQDKLTGAIYFAEVNDNDSDGIYTIETPIDELAVAFPTDPITWLGTSKSYDITYGGITNIKIDVSSQKKTIVIGKQSYSTYPILYTFTISGGETYKEFRYWSTDLGWYVKAE